MIDLVFCAMMATTLGAGVMLAGAAVLVVEGMLTLLAGAIAPLLSEAAVADLTCAGSLLVAAIGLNQTGAHEDQGGGLSAGAAVRAGHPLARGAAGVAAACCAVLRDTIYK